MPLPRQIWLPRSTRRLRVVLGRAREASGVLLGVVQWGGTVRWYSRVVQWGSTVQWGTVRWYSGGTVRWVQWWYRTRTGSTRTVPILPVLYPYPTYHYPYPYTHCPHMPSPYTLSPYPRVVRFVGFARPRAQTSYCFRARVHNRAC